MTRDDLDDNGDDRSSSGERQSLDGIEAVPEDVADDAECEVYDGRQPPDERPSHADRSFPRRDAILDSDDYRMPGGFDDGLGVDIEKAGERPWRMENESTEDGHEPPNSEEQVGYKRPPRSGRIKKGEVRNPYGRRGKRGRGPDLSESGALPLLLADRLGQKVRVKSGGKEKSVSIMEAIADKLMRDALAGSPKDRVAVLKLLDRNHILDALLAHQQFVSDFEEREGTGWGWSDELERRFRAIEAEFVQDADQEDLGAWLERKNPALLAEFRAEVEKKNSRRPLTPRARDGWGGYTEQ